jgi:predicted ribosome-associated RNA-binding protein Tma20
LLIISGWQFGKKSTPIGMVIIQSKSLLLNKIYLSIDHKKRIDKGDCAMLNDANDQSVSRVVISDAAVPFIARGGRLFSGQVIASDPGIDDGEEVLLVDKRNNPIRMVKIYAVG